MSQVKEADRGLTSWNYSSIVALAMPAQHTPVAANEPAACGG